jgi:hypothetical protein
MPSSIDSFRRIHRAKKDASFVERDDKAFLRFFVIENRRSAVGERCGRRGADRRLNAL